MLFVALAYLTANPSASSAAKGQFQIPPHLLRLRAGGSDESADLVSSLETLKTLLSSLDAKVRDQPVAAPPTAPEPPLLVEPSVGDLVKMRSGLHPKFEWGDVTSGSIGRLVDFEGELCVVNFPAHPGWHGLLSEMEKVDELLAPPQVGDLVRVRSNRTADVGEITSIAVERTAGQAPGRGLGSEVCDVTYADSSTRRLRLAEVETVCSDAARSADDDAPDDGSTSSGADEVSSSSFHADSPTSSSYGRASPPVASSRPPSPLRRPHSDLASLLSSASARGSSGHRRSGDGSGGRGRALPTGPSLTFRLAAGHLSGRAGVPLGMWLGWTAGIGAAQLSRRESQANAPAARHEPRQESPAATAGAPDAPSGTKVPHHPFLTPGFLALASTLLRGVLQLLSPLLLFASLLGFILSAVSIILDQSVSSLLDTAIDLLPTVLHTLQGLPGRAPRLTLSPHARSFILTPLRVPSVAIASLGLYLVCVPGFDLLVQSRRGFADGFRATLRARPTTNTAGGGAASMAGDGWSRGDDLTESRLGTILRIWDRTILLVQAARLAAVGIASLALLERLIKHHAAAVAPTLPAWQMYQGQGHVQPTTSATTADGAGTIL